VEEHDTTFLYNGMAEPWNTPFLVGAADPVSSSPNFADANAVEIESRAEGRKQVDTIEVMMANTTTSGACVVDSSRQSPSNGNDGVRGDLKPAQL